MTTLSPWLAQPGSDEERAVVRASWERARRERLAPDVSASLALTGDALDETRSTHPLAPALPVISRLLHRDADDGSGVLVAVGDAMGRLLWVDGDRSLKARAESMLFVAGADWSERRVGTSAPGTALAIDHAIQIHRDEHFAEVVQPWSCSAVPVHDPEHGGLLGVIDITGGSEVVDPHVLPLLEATAAAVERELLVQRLTRARLETTSVQPTLACLGVDTGTVSDGRERRLSLRHTEILVLLTLHPEGLAAGELAAMLSEHDASPVTLRAEMTRLRRALAGVVRVESRPYRLASALETDVDRLLSLLDRGAHRVALSCYRGPLVPGSNAPGVVAARDEVAGRLRTAILSAASAEVLYDYASTHGRCDREAWMQLLRGLPPRSPRRAAVVEHLERLDRDLA
ncbi:GAF domain-containing protein [Agrococcus sp. SGAir0287]|uniref:GAF domain-containing protein n=1 Tax=Agrococcus sp. SGAir0287 TaxID=2070347 RepID=UPI0010CCCC16|nr:GAF domain-containing protein [Agrococcus sp. SGAir0287]QCR19952.1 transcriptional regulator [Agrococcus sp. SGAir0287]